MGDIDVIARIVLSQTSVLFALGVGLLVLVPAAMLAARRRRWSRVRVVYAGLAGVGLALVPATTLARGEAALAWRSCIVQPGLSSGSPEAVLNALLFVPAAFFAVLALRRAAPVVLAALVCSAGVELIQTVTSLGACQTADVVRNVSGAVVAAGVAGLLVRASARDRVTEAETVSSR